MEEGEKTEYQVTMNGGIKGFEDIEKVVNYILKNKDKLYYCSIRKIIGKGSTGFSITRV